MTDLISVVPQLSTSDYSNILPSLERRGITAADLLTLDAVDIAKQAQVPARDVRRLVAALRNALRLQLEPDSGRQNTATPVLRSKSLLRSTGVELVEAWAAIGTLDEGLEKALGGGFPTGYLSEVTGESGAGKTQLLLTLLLAVQLPPPHGLSKSALYISTESALQTSRLDQISSNHPKLISLPPDKRPSLKRVLSIQTPDLESQEHILRYQLPIAIKRHDVGLVVIDSITANYRAEFERRDVGRAGAEAMARRSAQLMETAAILRELARREGIAIVVANQVADRFPSGATANTSSTSLSLTQETALSGSSSQQSRDAGGRWDSPAPEDDETQDQQSLTLDHQQRWFTGWGDTPASSSNSDGRMKTPSLGLVWTNQVACRVVLRKQKRAGERRLRLVFAPWCKDAAGGHGIKFSISDQGLWTEHDESDSIACKA